MLDINLIRTNPDHVAGQLKKRGFSVDFSKLLKLDEEKRKCQKSYEEARAKRNSVSSEIAKLKQQGQDKLANEKIVAMQKLGNQIAKADKKITKYETEIFDILSGIPNIPALDVVSGGKEANKVIKTFGKKPDFDFTPKDHIELCTQLGLIDYERGVRMSGSGAWVYTGMGARLEWALLNYFVDFHVANNYKFIMPPHLLNYESGYAAGQFPKFEEDVFFTNFDKDKKKTKFLLPTSETALINMHRSETIPAENLPIKYAAYSPCYRAEAGGYGANERGMIRGHQFNKIEMFIFAQEHESAELFNELLNNAEKLIEGLGLHYQTVALAAGDVGAAMAKTCDTEVYIPSMKGYKEVSSVSNAMCYQARRANIKAKTVLHECGEGACRKIVHNDFVHTLNASGLATSRLIPAIVEQFQNPDGSVNVPEVLQKYLGGAKRLG